jgi:hypothetical protein
VLRTLKRATGLRRATPTLATSLPAGAKDQVTGGAQRSRDTISDTRSLFSEIGTSTSHRVLWRRRNRCPPRKSAATYTVHEWADNTAVTALAQPGH